MSNARTEIRKNADEFFTSFPTGTGIAILREKMRDYFRVKIKGECDQDECGPEERMIIEKLEKEYNVRIAGLHWLLPELSYDHFITDLSFDDDVNKLISFYDSTWRELRGKSHLAYIHSERSIYQPTYFRVYKPKNKDDGKENGPIVSSGLNEDGIFVLSPNLINHFINNSGMPIFEKCNIIKTLDNVDSHNDNNCDICNAFWGKLHVYLINSGLLDGTSTNKDKLLIPRSVYNSFIISFYITFTLLSDGQNEKIFGEYGYADFLFKPITVEGKIKAIAAFVFNIVDAEGTEGFNNIEYTLDKWLGPYADSLQANSKRFIYWEYELMELIKAELINYIKIDYDEGVKSGSVDKSFPDYLEENIGYIVDEYKKRHYSEVGSILDGIIGGYKLKTKGAGYEEITYDKLEVIMEDI